MNTPDLANTPHVDAPSVANASQRTHAHGAANASHLAHAPHFAHARELANAPGAAGHGAEARARRRRRAAIAERLLCRASSAAEALDWDTLDRAPAWLALPDSKLATLKREVGAMLYAPQMRLWIDGRRLAAARAALGESFLQRLLAQRDMPSFPNDIVVRLLIDKAEQVGPLLQVAGAAVLLAALPPGPLRRAACDALAPVAVSTMPIELAQSLLARAQAFAAQSAAAAPSAAAPALLNATAAFPSVPAPAPAFASERSAA